ncbi:uncharacterized protein LOC119671576 [Teleopsis dalmanni]|uniref:uncharacterized protein LOC119671576 n=1 Tax=Teleopsis dalmanni TaxID=139649 RepID=UPI0018CFB0D6|nr:uncharacterized protein LOC119671576 [Teleopsis dalmanni]
MTNLENSFSEAEDCIPSAEELESYYLLLESGSIPELQWKSPGRRPLSPENVKEEPSRVTTEIEVQEPVKNDFDFSDDISTPQMRVRNQNSTPKSAKKKTANFAGVMEVLKKKNAEGGN